MRVEAAGIVECCMSSEDDRKLQYINYIGDGDFFSFFPYDRRSVSIVSAIAILFSLLILI